MAAMNTTREAAATLCGLLAGAAALGASELTAAVTGAMMNGTCSVSKADVVGGNVQTANATVYIINTVPMPPSS